jgi:Fur family peroxide stress response transcriptional regulator
MNNFTDNLRAHHLKATPQRLAIATTLHKRGHINIEDLYEIMLQKFNSISLATIYKNINIMIENAFIQEVKIPNQKSVYELTKESHSHLVCDNCGLVEDIILDLKNINEFVSGSNNFQIKKTDLVFSGLCQKCQIS